MSPQLFRRELILRFAQDFGCGVPLRSRWQITST
jgi:hypothetical protein